MANEPTPAGARDGEREGMDMLDLMLPILRHWKLLLAGPIVAGLVALGITYLIPKTYTARTVFLPPQPPQQNAAASAIAQLGALSGLIGGAVGVKSPADQYVALLQSASIGDRLVDEFKLMEIYGKRFRFEARDALSKNVRVSLGKKDGLITIEVDDQDPQRAAEMARRHVDELRRLTTQLALTEAQQRRVFFESQLKQTRDRLTSAQLALQASGFNPGALKAEPRAAAERYARLQAEAVAAQVRLQTMRRTLHDSAAEVQQQLTLLGALQRELEKAQAPSADEGGPDYVSKYREFKYQETLFELFARQYELARVDESREGMLIQVVDPATTPEYKSRPKRALVAGVTVLVCAVVLYLALLLRSQWHRFTQDPRSAGPLARLRAARGRA
jgi:uncharacterized protein involved in exopolysaccharide biosynthesis